MSCIVQLLNVVTEFRNDINTNNGGMEHEIGW